MEIHDLWFHHTFLLLVVLSGGIHTPKNTKSQRANTEVEAVQQTLPSLCLHNPILHLLFKSSASPFPGVCKYKGYQMSFLPLSVRCERKTCLQAIRICHQAHRVFLQLSDANQMVSMRDKLLFLDSGWLLAVDHRLLQKRENPNPNPVLEMNFLSSSALYWTSTSSKELGKHQGLPPGISEIKHGYHFERECGLPRWVLKFGEGFLTYLDFHTTWKVRE